MQNKVKTDVLWLKSYYKKKNLLKEIYLQWTNNVLVLATAERVEKRVS